MQPSYILTKEQYNELINSEANVFLEQHVQELEAELSKYQIYKRQMELDSDQLAKAVTDLVPSIKVPDNQPFIIEDGTLHIRQRYFIIAYNSPNTATTLTDADMCLFNYLNELAASLDVKPEFTTQSELKKYRVNLQKQGLYQPTKVKGIVQLTKT